MTGESHGIRVIALQGQDLRDGWRTVEAFVAQSLPDNPRLYEPSDVLTAALRGDVWVWAITIHDVVKGCIVAHPVPYPRCKSLKLWIVSGVDLDAWGPPVRDYLAALCRDKGIAYFEGGGRIGWMRKFGAEHKTHSLGPVIFMEI